MTRGRAKYEVAIYNAQVRDCHRDGVSHRHLKDEWADIHWIEVDASDPQDARIRVLRRYPRHAGYVVAAVQEAPGG